MPKKKNTQASNIDKLNELYLSAQLGSPESMYDLGLLYEKNKNYAAAKLCMLKAAGYPICYEPAIVFLAQHFHLQQYSLNTREAAVFAQNQTNIINGIMRFANEAKLGDQFLFPIHTLGTETNIDLSEEVENFKKGLCFGLSAIFLSASFVTDMQKNKTDTENEDDLPWLYRCLALLHLPVSSLSEDSKIELARFIGVLLHLHNYSEVVGKNIIDVEDKALNRFPQKHHMLNLEFTGEHKIEFQTPDRYIDSRNVKRIFELINQPGPLYLSIGLGDVENKNNGHSVCLHKDAAGNYRYYDPNIGVLPIKLDTIEETKKLCGMFAVSAKRVSMTWPVGLVVFTGKPLAAIKPRAGL